VLSRNGLMPLEMVTFEHRVLNILGSGGEGVAYLIEEIASRQRHVVKVYHKPHERIWSEGLIKYAQQVKAPQFGLPAVTLLGSNEDIQAVMYSYTHLDKIHWRILYSFESVAKAFFGYYCRIQYFLMANYGLCILDPSVGNFLMDRQGQLQFVDFGWLIRKIDHPRIVRQGQLGYALAMLLLDIYHENIKNIVLPSSEYSYDTPCIYFDISELDEIGERHVWVQSIVDKVQGNSPRAFLNPEFYLQLGEGLPDRIRAPWLVELFGQAVRFIRHLA
jgi:hypothetical protein